MNYKNVPEDVIETSYGKRRLSSTAAACFLCSHNKEGAITMPSCTVAQRGPGKSNLSGLSVFVCTDRAYHAGL